MSGAQESAGLWLKVDPTCLHCRIWVAIADRQSGATRSQELRAALARVLGEFFAGSPDGVEAEIERFVPMIRAAATAALAAETMQ